MKVFLAGIMHGSLHQNTMHSQNYRQDMSQLLAAAGVDVYDPLAAHETSLAYDESTARQTFLQHNRMCGELDLLVAFVPEASMGTAIEMWEAARKNRIVTTISPMVHNWTIRFCSDIVYETVEQFTTEVRSGAWLERVTELRDQRDQPCGT